MTELANPQRRDDKVKRIIPVRKIFFLPRISAARPNGIKKTAAVKIYEVAIQLKIMALQLNSAPMEGSATLIEDPIKGVRNEATDATSKAAFFCDLVGSAIDSFLKKTFEDKNNIEGMKEYY